MIREPRRYHDVADTTRLGVCFETYYISSSILSRTSCHCLQMLLKPLAQGSEHIVVAVASAAAKQVAAAVANTAALVWTVQAKTVVTTTVLSKLDTHTWTVKIIWLGFCREDPLSSCFHY